MPSELSLFFEAETVAVKSVTPEKLEACAKSGESSARKLVAADSDGDHKQKETVASGALELPGLKLEMGGLHQCVSVNVIEGGRRLETLTCLLCICSSWGEKAGGVRLWHCAARLL